MEIYRIVIFLLCMLVLPAASGEYQVATPAPGSTVVGLDMDRTGAMSKAGFRLSRVFAEYRTHVATQKKKAFKPRDRFLQFSQGRILIDAKATDDGSALFNDLQKFGLRNGSRYGNAVSGLLPVALIRQATELDSLRSIHVTLQPIRNTGSITSQGDVAMRADIARADYSVDGSGVTVGVMSDSYDTLGGAAADITSGDLPAAGVTVVNGESTACGILIFCIDEGRAMLQIVHDIAPAANLLFHTALSSVVDFANGISALEAAGADVIVDDLLYLNEPMFEDGIVAQAVDAVTTNGVAYYSAAGNQGRQSYETTFRDIGEILCFEIFEPIGDCHPLYERVGKMHDFDPGPDQQLFQSITIPYNATLAIAMQWDESFGNARTDHDVVLLNEDGTMFYEFGANDNVATGEGWEVLQYTNYDFMAGTTAFSVAITYDDVDSIDPPATLLKAVFFGNGITINDFPSNSSTLIGHANAAGAAAVGAAFFLETPEYGIDPPLLEPYSSAGGTPILFGVDGSTLPVPEVRLKPEFTAIDGVHTTFFFNDITGDGYDDFFGTSAAAPHAAGVAALILEADPAVTPAEIIAVLGSTAIDMLGAGFDYDSGYGLIQADAAIAALAIPTNTPPVASFDIGSITDLTVEFTDTSTDTDGTVTAWSWNFGGDGVSTVQNPTHTFSHAGSYNVTLTVTDNDGAADTASQLVMVTDAPPPPPPYVDQLATGETLVAGTVSGSYLNTQSDDGNAESIAERESGGKPSKRYSYLEHIWHFDVSPGNLVTLVTNAWSSGTSEGDNFIFAYSLDGSNYTDMFTVSSTNSANEQNYQLPDSTNGPVWVRVRDTDRTPGNRAQDTVFVDYLYIRSESAAGDPPTAPSDLAASAVSSAQIDLTWIDNALDESGFKVERSEDGGSSWTQVAAIGSADVTSYSDTNLSGSMTYHYHVAAYNASGTSSYSNTAYATTQTGVTLNATGYKVKGVQYVDLIWSGVGGAEVGVYRDEAIIATPENTGTYTDNIGKKGGGSYIYAVCETGSTPDCSDPVSVAF